MTKRRTITARLARDIIIRQLAEGYATRDGGCFHIACCLCGNAIHTLEKTQWEHITPLTLGGADDETNIRIAHDACSKSKTNGKAHDASNGDLHKIAKAKRIAAREALERGEAKAQKHKPKIQGRGFDKSLRKKMDGTVERRD